VLTYAQHVQASPVLGILSHWVRWAFFASALTVVAIDVFNDDRPAWLWAVTGLLLWPLMETVYTWFIVISDISHSAHPLFPRFSLNREGDAWPNQRQFIELRDWLRREKFHQVQSLKEGPLEDHVKRISVFQDTNNCVRLQVVFIPQPTGNVAVCYTFSSNTRSGARLVTDNVYLPFGGFYPVNWEVERRPWTRAPKALLRHHHRRLSALAEPCIPFEDEPLHDLNQQQQVLERTNTEFGFLFPRNLQEEHGRITWEGRYRYWKETWLLDYFGRPGPY
jgi:hypothetical protein